EEFQKQLAERDDVDINVAMTFSFGSDEEKEPTDPALVRQMFKDYASFTGVEYAYGDSKRGENAYYEDIVERATRGGSGRNPRNIVLVIVADQLLTGYDSKYINTLYVDRTLALQSLIQAYSRTNRLYGKEKEFGSIVNFQYPRITEEMVNESLVLYASGGESSPAIVVPYPEVVDEFVLHVADLKYILEDPTSWQDLETDEEAKESFLKAFKQANKQLNTIQQYYEFAWVDDAFRMSEDEWMRYVGAYRNLKRDQGPDDDDESVLPLSEAKLVGRQIIDARYIIQLIGEEATTTDGVQTIDAETLRLIYQHIEELSNLGEYEQAELLKQFVQEEVEPGNVSSNVYFDEAYETWKQEKMREDIYTISQDWGIDEVIFEKAIEAYSVSKPDEIPYRQDIVNSVKFTEAAKPQGKTQLMHNIELNK